MNSCPPSPCSPSFSVLIAPEEMLARALNGNPPLQQFRILFITGIRSGILSRLDRSSPDVRRAFTSLQLRTILEENHHLFLGAHTPLLYERAWIWLAALPRP